MTVQGNLFNYSAARGVRDTSHLAAEQLEAANKLSPRRAACLVAIGQRQGSGTLISRRLGLHVTQVRPRLTELEQAGFIEDSGDRHKTEWNTTEIVYQIAAVGVAALAVTGLA